MKMIQRSKVNQSSVCPPFPQKKNTHQTRSFFSILNPNHQLDKTGYKSSHSKRTTTVSISETAVSKQCKCSHPEVSHEPEGDKICKIIGCYCWGFVPVSKVV